MRGPDDGQVRMEGAQGENHPAEREGFAGLAGNRDDDSTDAGGVGSICALTEGEGPHAVLPTVEADPELSAPVADGRPSTCLDVGGLADVPGNAGELAPGRGFRCRPP